MKHRYLITTEYHEYVCDDYIMYLPHGVQTILVDDTTTDLCMITAPILSIHDYGSDITLEEFAKIREHEILMAKAEQTEFIRKRREHVNSADVQ